MSVPNNIYPNTRAEDERLIQRGQTSFGSGMISDVDPVDVPSNAVYDLDNMRATDNGLSGRTGTILWSNLQLPYEYENLVANRSGDTITLVSGQSGIFETDHIGYVLQIQGERKLMIIQDVVNPYEVTITEDLLEDSDTVVTFDFRGPLHASYYDDLTGSSYYMIGKKIYGRKEAEDQWIEYFIADEDELHSSASTFFKINKFICLANKNCLLVLNSIEEDAYTWRANTALPTRKINRPTEEVTSSYASRYNYSYSYSRIKDSYTVSRLDATTFVQRDGAPYLHLTEDADTDITTPVYRPDGKNQDYTTFSFEFPVACPFYTVLRTYSSVKTFREGIYVADNGYLPIVWNNENYYVKMDFRNVKSHVDVAQEIQDKLNLVVSSNARARFRDSSGGRYFDIFSIDPSDTISYGPTSTIEGVDGYNLFSQFFPSPLSPALHNNSVADNSSVIKFLVYPSTAKDITHYTLYRTADIYPHTLEVPDPYDERIQNKPELFGWVDDIPVCKISTVILTGSLAKLSVSGGTSRSTFNENDVGNTVILGTRNIVLEKYNKEGDYFTVSGDISGNTSGNAYFGADRFLTGVDKSGNNITGSDAAKFENGDLGRLIYWQDGTYSIIIDLEVTNGVVTNVYTADNRDYVSARCLLNPTYRSYNDTLPDFKLNGYISSFPMSMRYFNPMPNTNIASYTRGILLTGNRDNNVVSYSDAIDIAKIGYKNSNSQINNFIQDGVKSIVNANGYFTICTSDNTYLVNPAQAQQAGNPVLGESYTVLPDPMLNASGIGSTHQTKWAEGLNEGLIAVTNEPALRTYNGIQYGEDLSVGRVKRTHLQNMDSMIIVGYDVNSGIYLWGRGV